MLFYHSQSPRDCTARSVPKRLTKIIRVKRTPSLVQYRITICRMVLKYFTERNEVKYHVSIYFFRNVYRLHIILIMTVSMTYYDLKRTAIRTAVRGNRRNTKFSRYSSTCYYYYYFFYLFQFIYCRDFVWIARFKCLTTIVQCTRMCKFIIWFIFCKRNFSKGTFIDENVHFVHLRRYTFYTYYTIIATIKYCLLVTRCCLK